MAPQPMTSGISLAPMSARWTYDQPTEIASAIATSSFGRSVGTTWVIPSDSKKYSPKPPGASALCPMIRRPSAVASAGMELTRVPIGHSCRVGSVRNEFGTVFMAHDDVGIGVVVGEAAVVVVFLGMIHEVDVRGTDPAGKRAHQDLARPGDRILGVSDLDRPASEHGSPHVALPRFLTSFSGQSIP